MKLHLAVKALTNKFSTDIVMENRFYPCLCDLGAFEEFPAMRQVFKAFIQEGCVEKIIASLRNGKPGCPRLLTAFSRKYNFNDDLNEYARDSVLYALGTIPMVREPLTRGYDPFEKAIVTPKAKTVKKSGTRGRKNVKSKSVTIVKRKSGASILLDLLHIASEVIEIYASSKNGKVTIKHKNWHFSI